MSSPGVLGLEAAALVGDGKGLVVVLIGGEKPPRLMSGRDGALCVSLGGVDEGFGQESTREAIGIQNE
jgi:hypothetical protein